MDTRSLITAIIFLFFIHFTSCDTFRDNEPGDFSEAPKNVDGIWLLQTVSRNSIDITNEYDFRRFRLNLHTNGNYTIDNYLPFAVKKDGQWRVDDPQYPFQLIFTEEGSDDEVYVGLDYPIVEGKRIIAITLSPGCHRNSYTYVFKKENE